MTNSEQPVVVFDLGGVLIDWSPRYLYRKIFDGDEDKVTWFLENIATPDWNLSFDAGRPMADGIAELSAQHPDYADAIAAWWDRWSETVPGPIHGTVQILDRLNRSGFELHAITNFSAETFPIARQLFGFLKTFRTITVSGEIGIVKPDRRIFDHFSEQTGVQPDRAIFIDDSPANIASAADLGFDAIHFTSPEDLRAEMAKRLPEVFD